MYVSEHDVSFQVVSKNTEVCPPPTPPPLDKLSRSEKAQADPPCMLLSVTLTCFCGFYRQLHTNVSRIATLKAPEH